MPRAQTCISFKVPPRNRWKTLLLHIVRIIWNKHNYLEFGPNFLQILYFVHINGIAKYNDDISMVLFEITVLLCQRYFKYIMQTMCEILLVTYVYFLKWGWQTIYYLFQLTILYIFVFFNYAYYLFLHMARIFLISMLCYTVHRIYVVQFFSELP